MSSARCNCDSERTALRIARLMAWRLRRLQLFHGCPPAADAKGRREWERKCQFADRKIDGLQAQLGRCVRELQCDCERCLNGFEARMGWTCGREDVA